MDLARYWMSSAGGGYEIANSLRFRGAQQLDFYPTANSDPATFSMWVKRGKVSNAVQCLLGRFVTAGSLFVALNFDAGDTITSQNNAGGTSTQSPGKYRDPSAWYHIVWQLTGSEHVVYVNNEEIIRKNDNYGMWTGDYITVGKTPSVGSGHFDGYLAEFHCVSSSVQPPTTFGKYNTQGVWVPKQVSGLTYGQNGFYLDFSDPTDIGADRSGNGNNFTAAGFELTDKGSPDYDFVEDSPTNDYTTLNPLTTTLSTYASANLEKTTSNWNRSSGTLPPVSEGVWYMEATLTQDSHPTQSSNSLFSFFGLGEYEFDLQSSDVYYGNGIFLTDSGYTYNWYSGAVSGGTPAGSRLLTGDVIGLRYDFSDDSYVFTVNGKQRVSGTANRPAGTALTPVYTRSGSTYGGMSVNFGQLPFKYFPNETTPTTYFKPVTYVGNGTTQSITGVGFNPDLVWIKDRGNGAFVHQLYDTIRGTDAALSSNNTNAEANFNAFTSFDADGFTLPGVDGVNANGANQVAWCWNAGTSPAGINNSGTIQSTVKRLPEAGFSVVTYTGTGSAGTVGHGLGSAPSMVITKRRDAAGYDWYVYHKDIAVNTYLRLNTTESTLGPEPTLYSSAPDDTVINYGSSVGVSASGGTYVAYCFADTEGVLKSGSYVGNGSTDGPYIELGFKPAMIITKRTNSTSNWIMLDNVRDPFNPVQQWLRPNSSGLEENTGPDLDVDFLPSGFKVKNNATDMNISGSTYIYIAFAAEYTEGSHKPTSAFNTVQYDGINGELSVTGVGFSPDLVWLKCGNVGYQHWIQDTLRPSYANLASNATSAANSSATANPFKSFDADGFTVQYSADNGFTYPEVCGAGNEYVAWCFNAGADFTPTVTGGFSNPSGKASPTNGFSIVKVTGSNADSSFTHGLGQTPTMVIAKATSGAFDWAIYHKHLGAAPTNQYWNFNSSGVSSKGSDIWLTMDSTTVGVASFAETASSADYIYYCFADVAGKIKTGTFAGSGNASISQINECGFRPAMVMFKRADNVGNWFMIDSTRGTRVELYPDSSTTEATYDTLEFTDSGFHMISSTSDRNASGGEYIWIAFAQQFDSADLPLELNTANLPNPTIADPSKHFQTVLDTGANILTSAQSTFTNGLWWTKNRSDTSNHQLVDSIRGSTLALSTNLNNAQTTYFPFGGNSCVAWCWNLENDRGNGFDIVQWTGTNVAQDIPHNLSAAPEFIITKSHDTTGGWGVYHASMGATQYLVINDSAGPGTNSTVWNDTEPTSSVFSLGTSSLSNQAGANYTGYLWYSVPGFSSFGAYQGNSNANGPFIYTGFRPAWLLVRKLSSAVDWKIYDSVREPSNPVDIRLAAGTTASEFGGNGQDIDFLSNGFKFRGTNGDQNSTGTFIYAAFAEHPFKTTTAR